MIKLWHKFSDHFSKDFLLGVLGSGITRIGGMLAGFVFFAIIAQNFGADTMGRYAIATTIMGLLGAFCKLGFPTSIVRFVSSDLEKNQPNLMQQRVIWITKLISAVTVVAAVLLALSSGFIANHIFSDPALEPFLLIVSLILLPYSLSAIFTAYHQGSQRIGFSSALRNLVVPFFSCLIFAVLSYFITSETSSIWAQAGAILVCFLIGLMFYNPWKKTLDRQNDSSLSKEERKNMLAVSLPLLTGGISGMLLGWADTLMLGALANPEAAGLYATAFRLSVLISLPFHIVSWVIVPRIAAAYENKNQALQQKLLSDSVHLALAGAIIPILLFIFFGHGILSLFGSEFVAAYWVLIILTLSELAIVYFGFGQSVMIMTNQQKQYQNIMIGSVIFNIILNFFLIQSMGAAGAALATLLTQFIKQGLFMLYTYKYHGLVSSGGFAWFKMKKLQK